MEPIQSFRELSLPAVLRPSYHPSPLAWEDQVLYFLLLDRFSDGQEKDYLNNEGQLVTSGQTPRFQPEDAGNALTPDAEAWQQAGERFVGGTLRGLKSKIGYLKRLGISAIWISPVFKQVASQETYHGYGIQNFLEIEPRFGTQQDLIDVVETAHEHGIYVILDIILNHSGDVFAYETGQPVYASGSIFPVRGYRNAEGQPTLPFVPQPTGAWPDGAIWPAELQQPQTFTRKGKIQYWDHDPEFLEGDFESLKDIHHGYGPLDAYRPSEALLHLAEAYKYWIALADLDGFRIDTVKHMDLGATRFFSSVIREFTLAIGKENFYLIGEITGGRQRAFTTLELTGLDAALGIDDIPDKLEYLVKGYRNPAEYFSLFRNSELLQKESHSWFRNKVVTLFDDHDQVRKGPQKARFCADATGSRQLLAVIGLNVTSLGIPCLYYGTEQAFDGHGGHDRYIRESMFGGAFGAFRSKGVHFFREDNPWFPEISKLLAVRKQEIALRRGRQYLREISGDGTHFGYPRLWGASMQSVVAWSRILHTQEVLCALNTDVNQSQTAWVTVDNDLHTTGDVLTCLYTTHPEATLTSVSVAARNGKAVQLTLPPGGFVLYKKQ
ncbi:alpha-amylase [Siphonobacter sp. BAB-5405]|uniref:alpha-amylase family glycosyl hydrolase n=1 Tax=Siphonobacter sp. BAB-5405 TaxID=1864825 RepID=UPI000C80898E|nr:alpha-amylase family glycosyl hydrolase [Siphonobacter sp. BAB-5405]PMD89854.1 alpha-amylase [Siphonobacter sp. BAB-5405]